MITTDERKIIDRFVTTVTNLENKLNDAFPITSNSFLGLEERSKSVEIFFELRKCMKEDNHSYSPLVKVLKKLDTEKKYTATFAKAEEVITEMKNRSDSNIAFGNHKERNLSNWEAFQELESKYFAHSDGKRSPIKHIEPTSDYEAIYATQVVLFAYNLGLGVLGPLCFIAKELLAEADSK